MTVSSNVVIMTTRELDERCRESFLRGVERGKFEASDAWASGPYARNCANWSDGRCQSCGVLHQGMEVDADFRCPNFTRR